MTGYSPFQGETHQETFLNVTMCDYDFDDEMFDVVSHEAKDFIEKLLIVVPRYICCVQYIIRTDVCVSANVNLLFAFYTQSLVSLTYSIFSVPRSIRASIVDSSNWS